MKLLKLAFAILLSIVNCPLAHSQTANDFNTVIPYTPIFLPATNMAFLGNQFTDQNVSQLVYNAGARSTRPSLPDNLITDNGVGARLSAFQFYKQIGLINLTAFLGSVANSNRDTITFPGCDTRTYMWKGLYLPIWNDDGTINTANTYANYVFKTVATYGQYVKFWEIINEPDYTGTDAAWLDSSVGRSWWHVNPAANDLGNLKAPIYYYIRCLRISWEVIKRLQPNQYVCTGGIGYPSFLDALLRNTDNPVDGSITSEYPYLAGAYFDVLSFHNYPFYSLNYWDNNCGCTKYRRHSDTLVDVILGFKNEHEYVLHKYGYDNVTYPSKRFIITETDVARRIAPPEWGSNEWAINFIIKYMLLTYKNGIDIAYKYGVGDGKDTTNVFNSMGLYDTSALSSTATVSNSKKNIQFYAFKTVSSILYGKTYDADKTASLNLPANIRGVAFRDNKGLYTYVLWAKTYINESEYAQVIYTLPNGTFTKKKWDNSLTNDSSFISIKDTLTGSPTFYIEKPQVLSLYTNVINGTYDARSIKLTWKITYPSVSKVELQQCTDSKTFTTFYTTNNRNGNHSLDVKDTRGYIYIRDKVTLSDKSIYYSDITTFNITGITVTNDRRSVYIYSSESGTYLFFDVNGIQLPVIGTGKYSVGTTKIDISRLAAGIYYISAGGITFVITKT